MMDSTMRKKKILPFVTTSMVLMLSEVGQTEKKKYCMI